MDNDRNQESQLLQRITGAGSQSQGKNLTSSQSGLVAFMPQ